LTSADNYTVDLIMIDNEFAVFRIRDDPAEMRVSKEVINIGAAERMSKKGLGEEDAKS
jgi:hypothetical protein